MFATVCVTSYKPQRTACVEKRTSAHVYSSGRPCPWTRPALSAIVTEFYASGVPALSRTPPNILTHDAHAESEDLEP